MILKLQNVNVLYSLKYFQVEITWMLDVKEHMLILLPQNLQPWQSCTNSTVGAFNDFYILHFLNLTISRI
jgi:hypothetical protein